MGEQINFINQIEPWIDEKEKEAMAKYLDSDGWLTEFRKTREFEKILADYVKVEYASVVPNGTIALFVALKALGIGQGDKVIVPYYTMIASVNAIVLAGAEPILVDINSDDLCLDLKQVEESITFQTKAIMLVSIGGRCPNIKRFVELAEKYRIFLIEDACQSLGSRYDGKYLGTFGQIGCFSFSPHKIITTGQGGALVTNDKELYQKILRLKDFGRIEGKMNYEDIGYNFKFTDLQAVIGIEQIKKIEWRVKRKKEIYHFYKDLLKGIKEIRFIDTNLEDTAPWFIDILVRKRDELALFLKKKGIGTRFFYSVVHIQPDKEKFKNANKVSQEGLWLPSSLFLNNKDIEYVCDTIRSFFKKK